MLNEVKKKKEKRKIRGLNNLVLFSCSFALELILYVCEILLLNGFGLCYL